MSKKDLFIDTNIAKNFSNPLDPQYKELIKWLMKFDSTKQENNAHLAVSKKLIAEYGRTVGNSALGNNIAVIVDLLTKQGRLNNISNEAIKEFKQGYFTNKVKKKLVCNKEDREHIPVVLLSDRKYALTLDNKFYEDLANFPGFTVKVGQKPDDVPYDT